SAEDEPDHRGLARAVRADEADPIAAHDPHRQVAHDLELAEPLACALQLGDQPAGALARVERELDVPQALAANGALGAERLQALHAAFVARAACLDPLADPDFLLRPELVEAAVGKLFGGELVAPARFKSGEVARI